MPLVFRSALGLSARSPAASVTEAAERLAPLETDRLDCWYGWRSTDALSPTQSVAPPPFAGYWVRIQVAIERETNLPPLIDALFAMDVSRLRVSTNLEDRASAALFDQPFGDPTAPSFTGAPVSSTSFRSTVPGGHDTQREWADGLGCVLAEELEKTVGEVTTRPSPSTPRARVRFDDDVQAARDLFRTWCALVDEPARLEISWCGRRAELTRLEALLADLDRLDSRYGVSTMGQTQSAEWLLGVQDAQAPFREWGVRGTLLSGPAVPTLCPSSTWYRYRSGSDRLDGVNFAFEIEDPTAAEAERVRGFLADRLGPKALNAREWHYDGALCGGRLAHRYADLNRALAQALEPTTPAPPPFVASKVRTIVERALGQQAPALPALLAKALGTIKPSFRMDRRARHSDEHFARFVRQTAGGWQYIIARRRHLRPGHTLQVAISPYRLPPDDLEPASGRIAPGLVLNLEALVPELGAFIWRYRGQRSAGAAVAHTLAVVRARVLPFFDRCEPILTRFHDRGSVQTEITDATQADLADADPLEDR